MDHGSYYRPYTSMRNNLLTKDKTNFTKRDGVFEQIEFRKVLSRVHHGGSPSKRTDKGEDRITKEKIRVKVLTWICNTKTDLRERRKSEPGIIKKSYKSKGSYMDQSNGSSVSHKQTTYMFVRLQKNLNQKS